MKNTLINQLIRAYGTKLYLQPNDLPLPAIRLKIIRKRTRPTHNLHLFLTLVAIEPQQQFTHQQKTYSVQRLMPHITLDKTNYYHIEALEC